MNKKYSKYKTVKRKIASIKAFYSYLEYEEIITFSPFNKIRTKIKEPKMLPKIIQKEDLNRIFTLLFNNLSNANTEYKKEISTKKYYYYWIAFFQQVYVYQNYAIFILMI